MRTLTALTISTLVPAFLIAATALGARGEDRASSGALALPFTNGGPSHVFADYRYAKDSWEVRGFAMSGWITDFAPAIRVDQGLVIGQYDRRERLSNEVYGIQIEPCSPNKPLALGIGQRYGLPLALGTVGDLEPTLAPEISWHTSYGIMGRHAWVVGADAGARLEIQAMRAGAAVAHCSWSGGYRCDWIAGERLNGWVVGVGLTVEW